jgi:fido (protein-threonine AMPylation protein)
MSDPRTYTEAEERRLASQLRSITERMYAGDFESVRTDLELLRRFHAELFAGVRDHAGRIRSTDFGQEYLTFGPNRSAHRDSVEAELDRIFSTMGRSIGSLDDNPDSTEYEPAAIHSAVWAHAEVIAVHPFEDGNGRSSRLLMNWILLRVGLRPIFVEIPKAEYRECLNHYFATKDIDPLVDLMIRLYVAQQTT